MSSVSYHTYKKLNERFEAQKRRLVLDRDETVVPTIEQQNLNEQVSGAEHDFQETERKVKELDRLLLKCDEPHSDELDDQIKEMVNVICPMLENLKNKVQELEEIVGE